MRIEIRVKILVKTDISNQNILNSKIYLHLNVLVMRKINEQLIMFLISNDDFIKYLHELQCFHGLV